MTSAPTETGGKPAPETAQDTAFATAPTRQVFLAAVAAFLHRHEMSEHQFCLRAVGDHKFLTRVREGAGVTLTTIEKAEEFMALLSGPEAGAALTQVREAG